MWMQVGGYNINNEPSHQNHHNYNHHQLVVNLDGGRKLRPLIPRPPPPASVAAATHSCNFGLYTAGSVGVSEQGFSHKNDNLKEESNGGGGQVAQAAAASSRWNPTAEQLRTLEDLYRRGTRTPSTDQIQRITAQLRRFGKIEGKNVFYWFQNHKARERQKRRRDLQSLSSSSSCLRHPHHDDAAAAAPVLGIEIARKEIIKGKLGFDAEQTRSRYNASPAAEEYCGAMSMQRAEKTGRRAVSDYSSSSSKSTTHNNNSSSTTTNHNIGSSAVACLRFQLDDQRNATWHTLAPSSSPSSPHINNYNPFLKYCVNSTSSTADGVTFKTRRLVASDHTPHRTSSNKGELYEDEDPATLLQLFPLRSQVNDGQQHEEEEEDEDEDGQDQSKERDVHFFEFLPPKIN